MLRHYIVFEYFMAFLSMDLVCDYKFISGTWIFDRSHELLYKELNKLLRGFNKTCHNRLIEV